MLYAINYHATAISSWLGFEATKLPVSTTIAVPNDHSKIVPFGLLERSAATIT